MTIITLLLVILSTIIILRSRPITGLLVYCADLLWYPQYLTFKIGMLDFSLSRAIALILLLVVIFRDRLHNRFHWKAMDALMIIFIVTKLIAITQNELFSVYSQREGGVFVNTFIIYLLVRLIITDKTKLIYFFKGIIIISIPIAIIGIYQSITGFNCYAFTKQFHAFYESSQEYRLRHGLYRADASFDNYIAYGMYFASLVPISICLYDLKHKYLSFFMVTILVGGVLSSMSSGPYFSLVISAMTIMIFPFRGYWKIMIVALIVSVSFLEFYSNRSWYEALTRFAFSSGTAYYRVELIYEAFQGGMSGNLLSGYGYVGLDTAYNSLGKFWGWEHRDLVNIYIGVLVNYGLLGLVPFFMINIHYYQQLLKRYKEKTLHDSWIIWCFFATLIGWNIAMQTVGPLAQVVNMLYLYIGICANIPDIFPPRNPLLGSNDLRIA